MPKVNPDESVILAARRIETGANAHAIEETIQRYRYWCNKGDAYWRTIREYHRALIILTRGETTNAKKAMDMAFEYFFNLKKEEVRASGKWSKDWEPYLGPSPR